MLSNLHPNYKSISMRREIEMLKRKSIKLQNQNENQNENEKHNENENIISHNFEFQDVYKKKDEEDELKQLLNKLSDQRKKKKNHKI